MRIQFEKNLTNFSFTGQYMEKKEGMVSNPSASFFAYDVEISDEGRELYREKINEWNKSAQIEDKKPLDKELLSKSIVDITGLTMTNFHLQFKKLNSHGNVQDNNCSSMDLAKNCFATYTRMYDEIKQGYADGTRELWVVDETAENGFRKVTEQEELEALDSAYDFYAQVVDAYVNIGAKNRQLIEDAVNEHQTMLDRQRRMSKVQNDESTQAIENLYNKLKYAASVWKKEYLISISGTTNLFNQIFKNIFVS